MPWMMDKDVNIRKTYEELLEPKLSGNEIDDGPTEVFTSFQVRRKKD
jgi:hypothetical protein